MKSNTTNLKPIVDVAGVTRAGKGYPINEDGVYVLSGTDLQMLVAVDGVSKRKGYMATERLLPLIKNLHPVFEPRLTIKEVLDQCVEGIVFAAQSAIQDAESGCCFMLCFVYQNTAYMYHMGDCCGIILNNGRVKFQSKDETEAGFYYDRNIQTIDYYEDRKVSIENTDLYNDLCLPDSDYQYKLQRHVEPVSNAIDTKDKLIAFFRKYQGMNVINITTFNELRAALKQFSEHNQSGKHRITNYLGKAGTTFKQVKQDVISLEPGDSIFIMSDGISSNIHPTDLATLSSIPAEQQFLAHQKISNIMRLLETKKESESKGFYKDDDLTLTYWQLSSPPSELTTLKVLNYFRGSPNQPSNEELDSLSPIEIGKLVLALYDEYKQSFSVSEKINYALSELCNTNQKFCISILAELARIEEAADTDSIDALLALHKGLSLHWETLQIRQNRHSVIQFSPEQKKIKTHCNGQNIDFVFSEEKNAICEVKFQTKVSVLTNENSESLSLFSDEACTESKRINPQGYLALYKNIYAIIANKKPLKLKWLNSCSMGTDDGATIITFNQPTEKNRNVTISITTREKILVPVQVEVKVPSLFDSIIKKSVDNMNTGPFLKLAEGLIEIGLYKYAVQIAIMSCGKILLFSNSKDAKPDDIVTHSDFNIENLSLIVRALKKYGLLNAAQRVIQASQVASPNELLALHPDLFNQGLAAGEPVENIEECRQKCNRILTEYQAKCMQYAKDRCQLGNHLAELFVANECKFPEPPKEKSTQNLRLNFHREPPALSHSMETTSRAAPAAAAAADDDDMLLAPECDSDFAEDIKNISDDEIEMQDAPDATKQTGMRR
ncbi:MAG: hypothetical protein ACHP65_08620 [Legionellales bacterium]